MRRLTALTFVGVCGLASGHARAGRPAIEISADPTRSRNGEPVLFKVKIQFDGHQPLRGPRMPVLADWSVINSFQADYSQTSIVNGQISFRLNQEYTWILKPLRAGKLEIPAMDLYVGTTQYRTYPMTIEVDRADPNARPRATPPRAQPALPGSGDEDDPFGAMPLRPGLPSPAPAPDFQVPEREVFFIRAEPSSTRVYQGELINLGYVLYERSQSIMNPEISKFPDFKGFLKEELNIPKSFSRTPTQLNGKPYFRSDLIRYAVFPLKSGTLRIEPMTFKADYISSPNDLLSNMMNNMMGGLPQGMAGMDPIPMSKSSQSLSIESRPLPPAPADAHFTGGVGQFQLELKGPQGALRVDQPFTLQLTVAGTGNVKAITEPPLDLPKSIEPYQTKNNYEFREDASGYKAFEYLLLPRAPGKVTLPVMHWTYFDPKKEQYVNLETPALELNIEGAAPGAAAAGGSDKPAAPAPLRWSAPALDRQNFVRVDDIGRPGPLAAPLAWGLQAALWAAGAWLLARRRSDREEQARYSRAPWEKTARFIRSKDAWTKEELAILLDQWTRERLAGLVRRADVHGESSRDEFIDALKPLLHAENHRHLEPLKKFWGELDVLRFTGSGASETVNPKPLLERAEKIIEPLLKQARHAENT